MTDATDPIRLTQYSHGAGCGCKISPKVLEEILSQAGKAAPHAQLLVGNDSKDDAAVYDLGNGQAVISTTDFFMPIVDDPFDFGQIASVNAISDIYAMGGTPLMAIAVLGWPIEKLPPAVAGHGRRKFFDRPTKDRNGHQRRAAHGVNIANGIHRRDLSEVEGVIDDGHEKIRGTDHRLTVAKIVHRGVVLGIVAHEQLRVRRGFTCLAEDFLQHLGRDLAATTGCGCKISPKVLEEILSQAGKAAPHAQLLVGNDSKDDAAVYDLGNGQAVISTTDFFMPIVDDPFDFGQIASVNAISDIYAMGGTPLMAIAVLGWPIEKLPPAVAGHGRRKFFDRPTKDRNGHQRRAAHGVNIANGIHRRDLSEVEGVIDDGHEKIRGTDHRLTVAKIVHRGVVLGIVAHEQLRVRRGFTCLAEDFLQHLGRDLAAATGAMAVLGQANGIGGVSHGRWGNWRRG